MKKRVEQHTKRRHDGASGGDRWSNWLLAQEDHDPADEWDKISPFTRKIIRYIPNPSPQIIRKARHTVTPLPLSANDIIPSNDDYDWGAIAVHNYIHIIELSTPLRGNGALDWMFDGYHRKRVESGSGKSKAIGYEYYKGQSKFTLRVRKDTFVNRRTKESAYRLMLEVRLTPPFRQAFWQSAVWASGVIVEIERRLCRKRLRLRRIELPLDFTLGGWDYESVAPCVWRSHSTDVTKVGIGDETLYDGRNRNSKRNKIYLKDGCWHLEPTWTGRAFSSRRHFQHFSICSLLLMLIDIYESTAFRYLDLGALARSDKLRCETLKYWRLFTAYGSRAAYDAIRKDGYRNAQRFFRSHPMDGHYRRVLTATIAEGLAVARKDGAATLAVGKELAAILNNTQALADLKAELELNCGNFSRVLPDAKGGNYKTDWGAVLP